MPPFISLCMIVKNEEKVLRRCLESIKDHIDEIVIADTGSTDNTKKIALSYTSKVYDFDWVGDFSVARNFVQSKATGEWIIYLDADEYVDFENIKEIIQQLKESEELNRSDAFVVTQINFVGSIGGNVGQCPTIRIYKNSPTIQFHRKIHEQLYKKEGQLSIGFLNLNIYHSGYLNSTAQEKNKHDRNIPLIKSELTKNNKDGFDYYNLANEYLIQGRVEDALASYQKAFQLKGSINKLWVPMAIGRIVICLIELKRYNKALEVINSAVTGWPTTADFRSQRALIYFLQNRFEDAETELLPLIQDREKYNTIQSLSYLDYLPNFILGRINENNNDLTKAVYHYSQALNFNDKDVDTLKRLYPLLLKYESRENIIDFINKNHSMKNEINRAYFLKILLDNGEVSLVEYYLKEWNIVPSVGFKFKLNLAKGRYNYAKSLINKNSIGELLIEGWTDSYDILMLALQLEKVELFHKLLESTNDKDFGSLETLFTQGFSNDVETLKFHIVLVLERCILLKNYNLIDKILPKVNEFNVFSEIGNLFNSYGFEEIAMDIYQEIEDHQQFNENSYVNVINFLIKNGFESEAIKWAYAALEQKKSDYRIYKYLIEILDKRNAHDDIEKLIVIASEHYPNSEYLLEYKKLLIK
jgi:glycosyltransferase involved in cell wall biosynthesis